jgi:hypothetical protein
MASGELRCSSTFHELDKRRKWVVSFMFLSLIPQGKRPDIHWIGGWMGSKSGVDAVEWRKISSSVQESYHVHQTRSLSLCQLIYPGSFSQVYFIKLQKHLGENISICTNLSTVQLNMPYCRNLVNHKLTSESAHFESRPWKAYRGWGVPCFFSTSREMSECHLVFTTTNLFRMLSNCLWCDSTRCGGVYPEIMTAACGRKLACAPG